MDDEETENYTKLLIFTCEISLDVLHLYFEMRILDKEEFFVFLDRCKHVLYHALHPAVSCCECRNVSIPLSQKAPRLYSDQFNLLFDIEHSTLQSHHNKTIQHCSCKYSASRSVQVDSLDISLLCAIVKICCPTIPGNPQWIKVVKDTRNFLAHKSNCRLTKDEYDTWLTTVEKATLDLAKVVGSKLCKMTQKQISDFKKDKLSSNTVKDILARSNDDVCKRLESLMRNVVIEETESMSRDMIARIDELLLIHINELVFEVKTQLPSQKITEESIETRCATSTPQTAQPQSTQSKNEKKCCVEWKLATPDTWNVSEIKNTLQTASSSFKQSFEIEFVYIGSLIIRTIVPEHKLSNYDDFKSAVRSFLAKIVEVCQLDTDTPTVVKVDLNIFAEIPPSPQQRQKDVGIGSTIPSNPHAHANVLTVELKEISTRSTSRGGPQQRQKDVGIGSTIPSNPHAHANVLTVELKEISTRSTSRGDISEMTKLDQEFRLLLAQISDKLSTEDIKSLRFLLGHQIPVQDLENVKTGEDIFHLMMKHGLLSKTNTDFLSKMLEDKNLSPCVELLQTFYTDNEEELKKPEEGPCNIQEDMVVEHFKETSTLLDLQQKMETTHFVTLSGLLGSGKSQLALKYGCIFRKDHLAGLCWRIVCQSTLTLLNSLKRLADALGLEKDNTKQNENISNDESLISLQRLILNELRKSGNGKFEHLLILDDVTEETKHSCEILKDSFLKLEVKIIATTWNSAFCDEENLITVTGFTEEEAVDFLQQKKGTKTEDVKHYMDLAKQLGYLPLALYAAGACMRSSHMTPKRFIKYLKGGKSLSEIDKIVKSSSLENRKLFEVLTKFLEILKNDEGEDVFDMVLVLQFLAIEDIPVVLFDFLPTNRNQTYHELNTENFIQAVQKFSFGVLRGEDEDRFINTHLAVVKTISAYTQIEDKVRLCKKLLTALMLLMDKDNYHPKDYSRTGNLMQHAISILQHVKILQNEIPRLSEDFELNIMLPYVYDLVGYAYNFFGILKNAGEYSTAAKEACFALIGVSEVNIENTVGQACTRNEHHTTWEEFAEHKANLIFQKVKEQMAVPENYKVLQKLAKYMVLNKYRAKGHIEILQRYLGHDLEEEYTLTESEYRQLRDQQLAFPEDDLGHMFLFELLIQVFYTFGRRIFYLDGYERSIARLFSSYLFLAHALSKAVAEQYTQWKLLYVMLSELSGTLEQIFDDKAVLHLQTLENLEMAAERFKTFLDSNTTKFVFGVVKTDPENIQHMHICYKRLVRCYTSMASLTTDETKLAEIHEKGQLYAKKLEESKWSYRQISANLRIAELSLLLKHFDEAEDKFKMVAPDDMVQSVGEMGKIPLTFHELQALKGLTKCYAFSGKIELAKKLAERIEDRLALTKEEKELEHFKKVIFDLKLFD